MRLRNRESRRTILKDYFMPIRNLSIFTGALKHSLLLTLSYKVTDIILYADTFISVINNIVRNEIIWRKPKKGELLKKSMTKKKKNNTARRTKLHPFWLHVAHT